jgi:hypothetical protein
MGLIAKFTVAVHMDEPALSDPNHKDAGAAIVVAVELIVTH